MFDLYKLIDWSCGISDCCRSLLTMVSHRTIQLFQTVKGFYNTMGIYSPQTDQILPFNWKLLFFLWNMIQAFIGMIAYILFESSSSAELGLLCFGLICFIYSFSELLISLWRIPEILKFIELCEQFVEKRKLGICSTEW